MRRCLALIMLSLFLISCGSSTRPSLIKVIYGKDGEPLPDSQVNSGSINWHMLSVKSEADRAFKSIGSWSGSCSATLIAPPSFTSAELADKYAYILTNGHCIRQDPEAVLIDKSTSGTFTLNMFQDAASSDRYKITAQLIKYSTMNGTDIALIQLSKTYGDIADHGYQPIPLVHRQPASGTAIINVGIPQTGISSQNRYLRRSDCFLEERVKLLEGRFHFDSSIRNRCSVIGGSSGSPLLFQDPDGKLTMLAILNTGTSYQSSAEPCAMNNPCEIDDDGKTSTLNFNYGQDIYGLSGCFDSKAEFDLEQAECMIPRP